MDILDIHKKTNIVNILDKNKLKEIYSQCIVHSIKNDSEPIILELVKLMPILSLSIVSPISKQLHNKLCNILDDTDDKKSNNSELAYKLQFMLNHNEFDKLILIDDAKIVIQKLINRETNDDVNNSVLKDCIICTNPTELSYINYECFHIFFTCDDCRSGFEQLEHCPSCRENFFPRRCYLPE